MRLGWIILAFVVTLACAGCAGGGGGEKDKHKGLDQPKAPVPAARLR